MKTAYPDFSDTHNKRNIKLYFEGRSVQISDGGVIYCHYLLDSGLLAKQLGTLIHGDFHLTSNSKNVTWLVEAGTS
jgi:hypothetical protein